MLSEKREYLIEQLFEIGSVKFGDFTLKSGLKSPIYFDLRLLVSYPKLLNLTAELLNDIIIKQDLKYNIVCGVPYAAIPIATCLSLIADKPMIFKRKDCKSYGAKNLIEGIYKKNDTCLLVEDVVTYGDSIVETVQSLSMYDVNVTDAIVILDREQGGADNVRNHDVKFHSLLTSGEILNTLMKKNKISQTTFDETQKFLFANNCIRDSSLKIHKDDFRKRKDSLKCMDYEARSKLCKNKVAKHLFEIMSTKKTNLCVAVDVMEFSELLKIAEDIGPHICILKTHIDIINDFSLDKMSILLDIARKHEFLIFEDRKFADIGNTVQLQYTKGLYKISEWSDIVNAHSISGTGIVDALKEGSKSNGHQKSCLLVAQMSTKGNLITDEYIKETVAIAEQNMDFVIGFICQKQVSDNPAFIYMTPGIQIDGGGDKLGQQYTTPYQAIVDNKCDIIIVGRGIISQKNRIESAISYKNLGYSAYLKRLNN